MAASSHIAERSRRARRQVAAADRQIVAVERQIEDTRAARRQADDHRLSVIKWAIRVEGRRLKAAAHALRLALPSAPGWANRRREQLRIQSSPLLRGDRTEMSLLDDPTRVLLEEVAGIVDEHNSRFETATPGSEGPLIAELTLTLIDCLAEKAREMRSLP